MFTLSRMVLTGIRKEQAAYLLLLRKQKHITAETYASEKAKLHRKEEGIMKTKAKAQAKRDAKKAQRKAAKRVIAEEKKVKQEKTKVDKIAKVESVVQPDGEDDVIALWKANKGLTKRVIIIRDKEVVMDKTITIPRSYSVVRAILTGDAPSGDAGDVLLVSKIVVMEPNRVKANRILQSYRHGVAHCVFSVIENQLNADLEQTVSAHTIKKVKNNLSKIKRLAIQYEAGVPDENMEEVAKACGKKIEMLDVLENITCNFNKDGRRGTISLKNTRLNHVEPLVSSLVVSSNGIQLSYDDMRDKWAIVRNSGEWYDVVGDVRNGIPTTLRTTTACYNLHTEARDAINRFENEIGIRNYKINVLNHPEAVQFSTEACVGFSSPCDIMGGEATASVDMTKAFAQFRKCKWYSGFMGVMHQYRSGDFSLDFIREHIGLYRITFTKVLPLFTHVGIDVGVSIIIPSPEILMYASIGFEFVCDKGMWGSKFDMELPAEMFIKDKVGNNMVGRYSVWNGCLQRDREFITHRFPGDEAFAGHLMALGHEVYHYADGIIEIRKPNKVRHSLHHIAAFIISYCRIQVMEAMLQFKPENIVRVWCDQICYNGEKPALSSVFCEKPVNPAKSSTPWFDSAREFSFAPLCKGIVNNSALLGQGGAGKTTTIGLDKGFNDILYVGPTHVRIEEAKSKFPHFRTATKHKLLGIDCSPYKDSHTTSPVIIFDEASQASAEEIEKIFTMYPDSLILIAGDIDEKGRNFQPRAGDGNIWSSVWKPTTDIIWFLNDYRSLDDDLKKLKLIIREAMANIHDKYREDDIDALMMKKWARDNLPFQKLDWKEGDIVIAGTQRTNKKLLDMGVLSGYQKKGGAMSDVELEGYEKRGCYTNHSIQGNTIENKTIWVVVSDMFEYSMLYNAVARARRIEQIRFVWEV